MQTDRGPAISRREARRIESSRSRGRRPASFLVGFLVALVAFAGGGWAMSSLMSGSGLISAGKDGGTDSVRIVSEEGDAGRAADPGNRSDATPSSRTTTDASRATTRTKPGKKTSTTTSGSSSVTTTTEPARRKTTTKATAPTSRTSSQTATGSGGSGGTHTADEAEVLRLVNVERAKKSGCKPVTADPTLVKVARAHSKDMAVNGYFDHNSPNGRTPFVRMSKAGYAFSLAAENIAAGKASPAEIMDMWMNSAGHKANILNCKLTELGVGLWTQPGSKYTYYWTQDFGTPQ